MEARTDGTTGEVLNESEGIGHDDQPRSAFGSQFSTALSTPSTLHSGDSTGVSGYIWSRHSGTLGHRDTIGREFKGAKATSYTEQTVNVII